MNQDCLRGTGKRAGITARIYGALSGSVHHGRSSFFYQGFFHLLKDEPTVIRQEIKEIKSGARRHVTRTWRERGSSDDPTKTSPI